MNMKEPQVNFPYVGATRITQNDGCYQFFRGVSGVPAPKSYWLTSVNNIENGKNLDLSQQSADFTPKGMYHANGGFIVFQYLEDSILYLLELYAKDPEAQSSSCFQSPGSSGLLPNCNHAAG